MEMMEEDEGGRQDQSNFGRDSSRNPNPSAPRKRRVRLSIRSKAGHGISWMFLSLRRIGHELLRLR